jgi:hypothetical protein
MLEIAHEEDFTVHQKPGMSANTLRIYLHFASFSCMSRLLNMVISNGWALLNMVCNLPTSQSNQSFIKTTITHGMHPR